MTKSISETQQYLRRVTLDRSIERLGIISDIHANLPALEAVLLEAEVDAWLCLGDLVDYATEPDQVCAAVESRDMLCVLGNHDAYALGILTPNPNNTARYRLDWTRDQLSGRSLRFLSSLPFGLEIEVEDSPTRRIRAYHANTEDLETYLYKSSDWEQITVGQGELLAVGHTHIQVLESLGGGRIINPGSVGQPRDYEPGAAYAIFTRESGEVTLHRAAYDWLSYQERLIEHGLDEKLVDMLSRVRGPEAPKPV